MSKPFMRFQCGVWIVRTDRDNNSFLSWHAEPVNAYLGWKRARQIMGVLK